MSELRNIVISIIGFTKGRASKVVFYKRNKRWSCYIFELQCDNSIDVEIKQSLEDIKKYDPKAIIVDSVDLIKPDSDGFVWIDEIVDNILFLYSKGQANISEFLEKYAEKNSNIEQQNVMTTQEIVKIMEKQLKKLANWEISETSNGTSISAEMLEIAKFLIGAKKIRLRLEE